VICSPITESVPGMSITKVGSGTWILCGSNTYTGPTILVSGTLQIDGNQPASPVQVFGGTLTGSGVIGPLTTFGGTVQPGGANGGTLTVVGNATFNPATTIVLSFTTRLAVTGDVDLANSQLVFITNIACNPGDQVTLIASGGVNPISGIFAGLPQGSILHINGERLRINYQGVDGNDVILVCLPGVDPIVTGADAGGLPHVKLFDPRTGSVRMSFLAYDAGFRGGVRVALGDVNGDGFDDIITGSGPGTIAHVRVFDGRTGALIKNFFASGFAGGIYVGSGDVNGDGFADIIVGLGAGAASLIQVFDGRSTALIKNFFAFGAFTGGVRVAGGDLNGDGFDEILAGTGPGIAAEVRVFDGRSTALIKNFYPFGFFLGGIFVAAGDVNGDSFDDILVGADQGPPHVMVFDALTTAVLKSFYAYNPLSTGQLAEVPTTNVWRAGVRVAAADVNGDGFADIVTAPGPIPAPEVKVFDSLFLTVLDDFFAYDPYFRGGVFVGG
jgi:autotransporter-associated beta strand protein